MDVQWMSFVLIRGNVFQLFFESQPDQEYLKSKKIPERDEVEKTVLNPLLKKQFRTI